MSEPTQLKRKWRIPVKWKMELNAEVEALTLREAIMIISQLHMGMTEDKHCRSIEINFGDAEEITDK